MKKVRIALLPLAAAVFASSILWACKDKESANPDADEVFSGGAATVFDESENAFGHAAPNVSDAGQLIFTTGNSIFRSNWVTAPASVDALDGLGPLFNSKSCSGCHILDGRGKPPLFEGEPLSSMLIRLSVPGTTEHGEPKAEPNYGGQLSNSAILGVPAEGDVKITYDYINSTFDDGKAYQLRKPKYEFVNLGYGAMSANVMYSPRVAPQMQGLGLLEVVPEDQIVAMADPDDANRDGISGRPNRVWDAEKGTYRIGRLGWKANQPSMRQQVAGAFQGDLGISSSIFGGENHTSLQTACLNVPNGGTPELESSKLDKVTYYCQILAVPARRKTGDAAVIRGKALFTDIGCAKCHTSTLRTGASTDVPEFANQTIHPYTDLLLHDMGDGLADKRPDYEANGNEWRTPPLWGIGLIPTVNKHGFLLHDGRARNIEEAILWHGGEGETAQKKYKSLAETDRNAVIKFLEAL